MYYISTNSGTENWSDSFLQEVARVGYSHERWNDLRNHQRAGVAVASSLNGPWKRPDHPLLEPYGPIEHVAVNPSVCQGEDGKFVLIIKGDDVRSEKRRLIQAVGTGTSPLGPFRLSDQPALLIFQPKMFLFGLIRREKDIMPFSMHMEATLSV